MYKLGSTSLHVFNEEADFIRSFPYSMTRKNETTDSYLPDQPFYYYEKAKQLSKVVEKVFSFRRLNENWDLNSASLINFSCIIAGVEFVDHIKDWIFRFDLNIESPFVAPIPDGGIQFEWEKGDKYLEIGISTEKHAYEYLFMDDSIDYEIEDETIDELTLIKIFKLFCG